MYIRDNKELAIYHHRLNKEYDEIEKDFYRTTLPIEFPWGTDAQAEARARETRHAVAKRVKVALLRFAQEKKISLESLFEELETSASRPGQKLSGNMAWDDFIQVLIFRFSIPLTTTDTLLLAKHLKITNERISYSKFVRKIQQKKTMVSEKPADAPPMILEVESKQDDVPSAQSQQKSWIRRTKRFLKLVYHQACVYSVQKKVSVKDAMSLAFHCCCLDTRKHVEESRDERTVSQLSLFLTFDTFSGIQIDPMEQPYIFDCLWTKSVGGQSQEDCQDQDSRVIHFDAFYSCFGLFQIIKEPIASAGLELPRLVKVERSAMTSSEREKMIQRRGSVANVLVGSRV